MDEIKPRDNPYLIGHEVQEKLILDAWRNRALHHAYLISGPKGIGKATLAYRIARFLLNASDDKADSYKSLEISPDSQVFKQISANAHPDFKMVERGYIKTDRQKIYKALAVGNYMSDEELAKLKKSAEILIDDVREVNDFLAKSSAYGGWRVVIIDSVDEMNRSSANAILKILEEPPHKTMLLLVAHNPATLLPTIRSRCAKLELKPLKDNITASLLRRYCSDLDESKIKKLSALAEGSIGKAMIYAGGNAVEFYERIKRTAQEGKKFKIKDILDFSDDASKDGNYELFKELIGRFLVEQAKSGINVEQTTKLFDDFNRIFKQTESLNLDKKQVVMNMMVSLTKMGQE